MRALKFLLLATAFVACSREPQLVSVTFDVATVQSGEMTKVATTAVSDALAATAPTGPFTLNAVSTTNSLRTYKITTGETNTMAVDTYTDTGSGSGSEIANVTSGKLYSSPKWSVNKQVAITSDGGAVSVSASYPCVAFIIDKAVTSKLIFNNGADDVENYTYGGTSEVGVVYADGTWGYSNPLRVRVKPVDTVNQEETLFKCAHGDYDGMLNVRNGYWYNLVPGAVETASGAFGLTFSGWEAGQ